MVPICGRRGRRPLNGKGTVDVFCPKIGVFAPRATGTVAAHLLYGNLLPQAHLAFGVTMRRDLVSVAPHVFGAVGTPA